MQVTDAMVAKACAEAEERYMKADAAYQRAVQNLFSAESDMIKAGRERSNAWQALSALPRCCR